MGFREVRALRPIRQILASKGRDPSEVKIDEDERMRFWMEKIQQAAGELSHRFHACIQDGITEDVIAARLGMSPAHIEYAFGAPLDMSIKQMSDLALAMDCDLEIKLVPFSEKDTL